jgi:hypothetical protein
MSARKTISLLEKQIADHEANRRKRYERIFETHANEADRDAAIEADRAEYMALQDRLIQTMRQERNFLVKKTALLRIRNEMSTPPITAAQALKQKLAAKLAGKNTGRAPGWLY